MTAAKRKPRTPPPDANIVHIAARRIENDRGAIQNALDPLQIDMLAGAA